MKGQEQEQAPEKVKINNLPDQPWLKEFMVEIDGKQHTVRWIYVYITDAAKVELPYPIELKLEEEQQHKQQKDAEMTYQRGLELLAERNCFVITRGERSLQFYGQLRDTLKRMRDT